MINLAHRYDYPSEFYVDGVLNWNEKVRKWERVHRYSVESYKKWKFVEETVLNELKEAGIPAIEDVNVVRNEVHTRFRGELKGLKFQRYWYYWVVDGEVSYEKALLLYSSPVGKKDIRVRGHCGCPPPTGTVYKYHIDSQEALNFFVKIMKEE